MCGIFFAAHRTNGVRRCSPDICEHDECEAHIYECYVKDLLGPRGPDATSIVQNCEMIGWDVFSAASVLWMQGKHFAKQPHVDSDGNILLWNGDVFFGPMASCGETSDTICVAESLQKCNSIQDTIEAISKIIGPFSIVYLNPSKYQLWFCRDVLGRHSLLSYSNKESQFVISSVSSKSLDFQEVPALGIFLADFSSIGFPRVTLFPWSDVSEPRLSAMLVGYHLDVNIQWHLLKSPLLRLVSNTIFDPSLVVPACLLKYSRESSTSFFTNILSNEAMCDNVEKLINLLKLSVKVRCDTQCQICKNCMKQTDVNEYCEHSKVGVLFSGGLDSTVIAALAHECVPLNEPIDLVNVAFEPKKQDIRMNCKERKRLTACAVDYNVPDRKTGVQSLRKLQSLYPGRKWNFVQVDVTREEMKNRCFERIADLIHPHKTILDESLGCALWFASRGQGQHLVNDTETLPYSSPTRVLLVGIGADEQLGGYSRHRIALQTGGWPALEEELHSDLVNISSRNLGRDDRVIADHGRQARFPFLDETLVNFLTSLKPWEKCFPVEECPKGIGDKLLLRLAAFKLGFPEVARFPKRALQFGSRIADSKQSGHAISNMLMGGIG